ncbi:MAG: ABC transporter ATP-binding protein [Clostridiaceae bacterium]|jgi:branched-chain amino acid transport system ATP-binding protein|nr:ABC transporter ATP-binding protein [Clostridiaceae bacterium]
MSLDSEKDAMILSGSKVTKNFGGLLAVSEVDFEIKKGSIVGLIGPNGAGKTTLFNCITGNQKPTAGDIRFKSTNLASMKVNDITKLGISRTFQNIRLFKEMTVLDNVLVGMHTHVKHGLKDVMLKTKKQSADEGKMKEKSLELLKICELDRYTDEYAKNLSYGEQRRLEIARALATEPELLLLDEPSAGMNINETRLLEVFIHSIREQFKLSIILIEHDMKFVMGLCERIIVLNNGQKIAEGLPKEIQNNEDVIRAYLGGRMANAGA